ncbi:MAG: RNA polymerase sigma factor [Bradymonadia bacterium]
MTAPDDHTLLLRCIDGDGDAWHLLVGRFTRYVYHLIRATAHRYNAALSEAAVADLHNDLFLALLEDDRRRLRAYEGKNGCSVRSWIRIITIRRTLDHLRRQKPTLSLDALTDDSEDRATMPEPVDPGPDPLEHLIEQGAQRRREALGDIASALSDADRLLLSLIYERQMPAPQIAALLRVKVGAVYTRKNRLIARLRRLAEAGGWLDEA